MKNQNTVYHQCLFDSGENLGYVELVYKLYCAFDPGRIMRMPPSLLRAQPADWLFCIDLPTGSYRNVLKAIEVQVMVNLPLGIVRRLRLR